MKIESPMFFKARKDKNLSAFLVIRRIEKDPGTEPRTYIRLCIDQRSKYTDDRSSIFLETNTMIHLANYSVRSADGAQHPINSICFYESVYGYDNHIRTFLYAIKKESDVSFKVLAFNNSDFDRDNNLVSHQLLWCHRQ
ncbi:hypothetical protein ACQ86N_22570 [Puia sp. P3]|uniref:hypothetical protein n=1 Tax=Puia sp. P3 TaxID=3423952 RepID=UPI003D66729E